jgi:hypothetical protein
MFFFTCRRQAFTVLSFFHSNSFHKLITLIWVTVEENQFILDCFGQFSTFEDSYITYEHIFLTRIGGAKAKLRGYG